MYVQVSVILKNADSILQAETVTLEVFSATKLKKGTCTTQLYIPLSATVAFRMTSTPAPFLEVVEMRGDRIGKSWESFSHRMTGVGAPSATQVRVMVLPLDAATSDGGGCISFGMAEEREGKGRFTSWKKLEWVCHLLQRHSSSPAGQSTFLSHLFLRGIHSDMLVIPPNRPMEGQ